MKTIHGKQRIGVTKGLLSLILMVQEYEKFLISKSEFQTLYGLQVIDVQKELERFFNSLDDEILATYALSKDKMSLEKVLRYEVTDTMKAFSPSYLSKIFTF